MQQQRRHTVVHPRRRRSGGRFVATATGAVTGAVLLAACDFSVINPGPVQDPFLDDEGAHNAVVQGASFSLSSALWQVSYLGAEAAREITRSGRNYCCPKSPPRTGEMTRDGLEPSQTWQFGHRARFTAEDATRRFAENDTIAMDAYAPNARARLYAGYANRLLGENMCVAIFDSGEPGPVTEYFQRAEQAFTDAMQIAERAGLPEVATAALAGRASVRGAGLNRWADAAADAADVPEDFVYQAQYSSGQSSQYNIMYDLSAGDPWVDWTAWDTSLEDHYRETGDSRTPWIDRETTDNPLSLPLLEQRKFTSRSDDVNLSSGREMKLVRAEAALHGEGGTWQEAVDLINELRASTPSDQGGTVPPVTASNAEEAWTALKNERLAELWLEGRRLGDLRRWIESGTPGLMVDTGDRIRLCVPVSQSEVNSNPNLSDDYEDPRNPSFTGG